MSRPIALALLVALGAIGYAVAPASGGQAGFPPPSPDPPYLTQTESTYYSLAWRATVARDHPCNGLAGPTFTTGAPSASFVSRFAILRRPPTPTGRLPTLLHHNLGPLFIGNGVSAYNWELYLNQIRVARSAFGANTVTLHFASGGRATTALAVDNVVVVREPHNAADFPSAIVLRGADGRVIRRIALPGNLPGQGGC
jgi:hypothetical protein